MECPYCGAELIQIDEFGNREYICRGIGERTGDIYKCPNVNEFECKEDAERFLEITEQNIDEFDVEDWTELCCDSNMQNGHFYTYLNKEDDLREGYPC